MNLNEIYLIYTVSFVIGSLVGLLLSYRKYRAPFVDEKIDPLALAVALVGWIILVNASRMPFTEPLRVAGLFMVAMVAGMRPGYGRYETAAGLITAAIIWLTLGALGW